MIVTLYYHHSLSPTFTWLPPTCYLLLPTDGKSSIKKPLSATKGSNSTHKKPSSAGKKDIKLKQPPTSKPLGTSPTPPATAPSKEKKRKKIVVEEVSDDGENKMADQQDVGKAKDREPVQLTRKIDLHSVKPEKVSDKIIYIQQYM